MIQVLLDLRDNHFHRLKISGHENTDNKFALICNSVSILGQNFTESLLVLTPEDKYRLVSKSGLLEITNINHCEKNFLTSEILLKSFLIGIEKIKRIYKDEIELIISTSS
ncbi:ribosomal-processing cysteine protease Prp [bacterium]|nr:ribosomal-processing cysteine protease Prp [bacterium]